MNRRVPVLVLVAASALAASADQWPAWRGPNGNGICAEKNLPLHWNTNQNVRWRVALPDRGISTPVAWGQRVFITQAIDKENRRTVMCFHRTDGKLLWQSGVTWTDKEPTPPDNPYCSPSPVTDGRRVFAWFGSAGVYCYDLSGRELWRRDLGRQSHQWGHASSPMLYRDLCILNFGPGERSFVIALEAKTGRTVWQYGAPHVDANAKWEDFGGETKMAERAGGLKVSDISGSWSTPLLVHAAGRDEVLVAFPLRLLAFAPTSGELLWDCDFPNIGAYPSAFSGDGVVSVSGAGLRNTSIAVRPGGHGDVTATHRLWILTPPNSKACIGSGLIRQGHIYQVSAIGIAECLELRTGKSLWAERLTGSGTRNAVWSSPVLAGDRLYVANQNADVFVLRAGPKFELLATNPVGGETMNASPAISDGAIFLRTHKHLWCIAASKGS